MYGRTCKADKRTIARVAGIGRLSNPGQNGTPSDESSGVNQENMRTHQGDSRPAVAPTVAPMYPNEENIMRRYDGTIRGGCYHRYTYIRTYAHMGVYICVFVCVNVYICTHTHTSRTTHARTRTHFTRTHTHSSTLNL